MNWIKLTTDIQLADIHQKSSINPQVIFKHSTRCSISQMALNRLERSSIPNGIDFHFLDLIAYRKLSDKIATDYSVYHESPQILLIKNGECVYAESHSGIDMEEIVMQAIEG